VRRFVAAAVTAAFLAGPIFATEIQVQEKKKIELKKTREEAAKEEAEAAKAGLPAKPTAGPTAGPTAAESCAPQAAPPVGSAGFFKTVEDIYGFQGSVEALSTPTPVPAAAVAPTAPVAAPAAEGSKDTKPEASKAD